MLDGYWFIVVVLPLIRLLLVVALPDVRSKNAVIKNKLDDISSGLLSVYLLADHPDGFLGYDLLQSCTANNLCYDKSLAIFHKYCNVKGQEIKCFSIAKASKPGFFDINSLGGECSKGIVCFIDIKNLGKHALEFYDDFVKTLDLLQHNLGGKLYDRYKNPITDLRLNKWREYAKITCMRYGTTDFFK